MEPLEPRNWQVLLRVRLLMQVPPARLPTVPRKEDIHLDLAAGGREGHPQTIRLAFHKRRREALAAPPVIDVLVPIVAVHCQRPAVPPRHAEGRVRQRRVPNGERRLARRAVRAHTHLVVDRLGPARRQRAVLRHGVQRRVADDAVVAAALVRLARPHARRHPRQRAPVRRVRRRRHQPRVVERQCAQRRRVQPDRRAERVPLHPCLAGVGLRLRRV